MIIELINPRYYDGESYDVDFAGPDSDVSGTIVIEEQPNDEGRYGMGIIVEKPLPGAVKILSESKERHLTGISDEKQLAAWINLAVSEVRTRH